MEDKGRRKAFKVEHLTAHVHNQHQHVPANMQFLKIPMWLNPPDSCCTFQQYI